MSSMDENPPAYDTTEDPPAYGTITEKAYDTITQKPPIEEPKDEKQLKKENIYRKAKTLYLFCIFIGFVSTVKPILRINCVKRLPLHPPKAHFSLQFTCIERPPVLRDYISFVS